MLVNVLTEHLEVLVYYLLRNEHLKLMIEVRDGSEGSGILCSKVMVLLGLWLRSPRQDNVRRGGRGTDRTSRFMQNSNRVLFSEHLASYRIV